MYMSEVVGKSLPRDRIDEAQLKYREAVTTCDESRATQVIDEALRQGLTPTKIYLGVIGRTQAEIKDAWKDKKFSVCHEHLATQISLQEMARLRRMIKAKVKLNKRAVVVAVEGDDKFIGPRMIADFLSLDGWDVDSLGVDTPIEDLVNFITGRPVALVTIAGGGEQSASAVENIVRQIKTLPDAPKVILYGEVVKAADSGSLAASVDAVADDVQKLVRLARATCGLGEADVSLSQYLKSLGGRIVTLRKEQSMSQQQLAELADLDRAYISALENGKQNVTVGAIAKLAEALDVSLQELLVEIRE